MAFLFICVEGISQAETFVFPFDAAHEREKLAKHASHRFLNISFVMLVFVYRLFLYNIWHNKIFIYIP